MEYILSMVFSEKKIGQTVSDLHLGIQATKFLKKLDMDQTFLPMILPRPTFPSSAAFTHIAKPSSAA